jgi:hypothetical protein
MSSRSRANFIQSSKDVGLSKRTLSETRNSELDRAAKAINGAIVRYITRPKRAGRFGNRLMFDAVELLIGGDPPPWASNAFERERDGPKARHVKTCRTGTQIKSSLPQPQIKLIATQLIRVWVGVPVVAGERGGASGDVWILSWGGGARLGAWGVGQGECLRGGF